MKGLGPCSNAADAFVAFVLRHLRVKTFHGSRQKHEHGYRMDERVLKTWNFIHVTRGRVVWVLDGSDNDLRQGDLLLVPPGLGHHAFSRTQRITLSSLHVEVMLPGGQDAFKRLHPPLRLHVASGTRLDRYLRAYSDEYDRSDPEETRRTLEGWAALVAPEYIRYAAHAAMLSPQPLPPVVAGVLDVIARRADGPWHLGGIARKSGYSPQHLNRLFQATLGMTPLRCHARIRLERAATLLREDKLSVRGVAERLGYPDPYYFSRAFKKFFRLSPQAYCKSEG